MPCSRGRICVLSLILGANLAGILLMSSNSLGVDLRRYHFYKAVLEYGSSSQNATPSGDHANLSANIRRSAASTSNRTKLNLCPQLRFQDPPGPVVGLVSFPGSGNTWVRYLIQQATGIYTGSVYKDIKLLQNGFPGENMRNGSVVVVKTHGHKQGTMQSFSRAILLVRSPGDAILAEFNRIGGGHIGFAPPEKYLRNKGKCRAIRRVWWYPIGGAMPWCRGRIFALSLILGANLAGILLMSSLSLGFDLRRYHFYKAVVEYGSSSHNATPSGGHANLSASIRSAAVLTSKNTSMNFCPQLRFQEPPGPVVGLVSFPGSGNTWVRYLIQQATGIYTGSIYKDKELLKNGFPAEYVTNGSVVVVKIHGHSKGHMRRFSRAVLLVRSPREAIQAEFNRKSGGHTGFAAPDMYQRDQGKFWHDFVTHKLSSWTNTYMDWLRHFAGPKYVLFYDNLVNDLEKELRSLISFLNVTLSESNLQCALTRKEGNFRRPRKLLPFDPFTPAMKESLRREQKALYLALANNISNISPPPIT